jgi:hypothetical protein
MKKEDHHHHVMVAVPPYATMKENRNHFWKFPKKNFLVSK